MKMIKVEENQLEKLYEAIVFACDEIVKLISQEKDESKEKELETRLSVLRYTQYQIEDRFFDGNRIEYYR